MASVTASEAARAQDGNHSFRANCNLEESYSYHAMAQNWLESQAQEGDSPVRGAVADRVGFQRVGLFDIAALSGR